MSPLAAITVRTAAELRRRLAGAHPTTELARRIAAAKATQPSSRRPRT